MSPALIILFNGRKFFYLFRIQNLLQQIVWCFCLQFTYVSRSLFNGVFLKNENIHSLFFFVNTLKKKNTAFFCVLIKQIYLQVSVMTHCLIGSFSIYQLYWWKKLFLFLLFNISSILQGVYIDIKRVWLDFSFSVVLL